MHKKLYERLLEAAPKFNQTLVQGMAVHELPYIEEYIDQKIMRVVAAEFPPRMKYLGYCRATPDEESAVVLARRKSKKNATFEIAPSDMYMVRYMFSFDGVELDPVYIMLPFVRQGGILMIRGSMFQIMPVVADRSISIGTDTIFLSVSRVITNLQRQTYNFRLDGRRESYSLVYAKLHNKAVKSGGRRSPTANMKTCMPHYLFAQYGLVPAFQKYCKTTIEIGYEDKINAKAFPPEDWAIFSSWCDDPRDNANRNSGTRIRIAVRRDKKADATTSRNGISRSVMAMVVGFFYLADHFPERVIPEYVHDRQLWIVLLGTILFGPNINVGMLAEGTAVHLKSLDNALDPESKENLNKMGIPCETLYDVLADLNATLPERMREAVRTVPSMYGKRLIILHYLLRDLAHAANNLMFQLTKDMNSGRRQMTRQDVTNALRKHLKMDVLFKISGAKHGEVVSANCPGDNMVLKLTSQTVLQSESNGPRSRSGTVRGRSGMDASKNLHVSVATHGSYNTMSKSGPDGRNKLNPYGTVDSDGVLYMDPAHEAVLLPVQEKIQRF